MKSYLISVLLLLLSSLVVNSRPTRQRIIISGHTWEVPNEPGWEEILETLTPIQQLLAVCSKAAECHRIVKRLHAVFNSYPASRKYLDSLNNNDDDMFVSIFKWG